MKILFYSTVFAPMVGGIETLVETLCREFTALGHNVIVVTEAAGEADLPFLVERRPSIQRRVDLLKWCDIQIQANVSLKVVWMRMLAMRKTIYQHNNVPQRDDGTKRVTDRLKWIIARMTPGIAVSNYTAEGTGANHVIFNAYDDEVFGPPKPWEEKDRDLVFLGRLVSQKGCDNLIHAMALLSARGVRPNLTVIGDGPERAALEQQVEAVGIIDQVRFLGNLRGFPLAAELARHRLMIVPSRYEEPFGIVALEGLASGCIPIVSKRGGLVDAINGHGFTFPNGDEKALAERIVEVMVDYPRARTRLEGLDRHLRSCQSRAVAEKYIAVFEEHLAQS